MKTCQHPDSCSRPHKGHGWCRAHLDRVRKTGLPGPASVTSQQSPSRGCALAGCTNPVGRDGARGYCGTHYQRVRKHGNVSTVLTGGASLPGETNPNWSGDKAQYAAAHKRVTRARGRAREHSCVDCGKTAAHWSYDGTDPNASRSDGLAYSLDVDRYVPRCVSCHSKHDRAQRLPISPPATAARGPQEESSNHHA